MFSILDHHCQMRPQTLPVLMLLLCHGHVDYFCSNAKHQVERRLIDWKLTEEGAPETYALPPVSVR